MYTVYLLRDPNPVDPLYLIFVADEDDQVIPQTTFGTTRYSEAVFKAGILFELFARTLNDYSQVATYIESPYESEKVVSYSQGEFRAKKTGDHYLFLSLIDKYESYLVLMEPEPAFKKIVRENKLTPDQKIQLLHLISVRPEIV